MPLITHENRDLWDRCRANWEAFESWAYCLGVIIPFRWCDWWTKFVKVDEESADNMLAHWKQMTKTLRTLEPVWTLDDSNQLQITPDRLRQLLAAFGPLGWVPARHTWLREGLGPMQVNTDSGISWSTAHINVMFMALRKTVPCEWLHGHRKKGQQTHLTPISPHHHSERIKDVFPQLVFNKDNFGCPDCSIEPYVYGAILCRRKGLLQSGLRLAPAWVEEEIDSMVKTDRLSFNEAWTLIWGCVRIEHLSQAAENGLSALRSYDWTEFRARNDRRVAKMPKWESPNDAPKRPIGERIPARFVRFDTPMDKVLGHALSVKTEEIMSDDDDVEQPNRKMRLSYVL